MSFFQAKCRIHGFLGPERPGTDEGEAQALADLAPHTSCRQTVSIPAMRKATRGSWFPSEPTEAPRKEVEITAASVTHAY